MTIISSGSRILLAPEAHVKSKTDWTVRRSIFSPQILFTFEITNFKSRRPSPVYPYIDQVMYRDEPNTSFVGSHLVLDRQNGDVFFI